MLMHEEESAPSLILRMYHSQGPDLKLSHAPGVHAAGQEAGQSLGQAALQLHPQLPACRTEPQSALRLVDTGQTWPSSQSRV